MSFCTSQAEGRWLPAPGYKYLNDIDGDVRVIWSPGLPHTRHPNVLADDHRFPVGIEHVIVNGTAVVDGGTHTGATPGRALKRRIG